MKQWGNKLCQALQMPQLITSLVWRFLWSRYGMHGRDLENERTWLKLLLNYGKKHQEKIALAQANLLSIHAHSPRKPIILQHQLAKTRNNYFSSICNTSCQTQIPDWHFENTYLQIPIPLKPPPTPPGPGPGMGCESGPGKHVSI